MAYVLFGNAGGFPSEVDLSTLSSADGFTITDESGAVAGVGFSVSAAGDVNGDGIGDLLVGTGGEFNTSGGHAYVIFGNGAGFGAAVDVSALNGNNGFAITGVDDAQGFQAVAKAGDVNGDGFADVIVGSALASVNCAYVVFGNATDFDPVLDVATLNGANGFKLTGADGDGTGSAVSGAGDVNGDGFDDIILGAPAADGGIGTAYVVFGRPLGMAADLDLTTLNGRNGFKMDGSYSFASEAGRSVAGVGDVNGDGYADVLVGGDNYSSNPGISVILGKAARFAPVVSSDRDITGGPDELFGLALSGAGDVNGDGFDDAIVGAPGDGGSGAAYVLFGGMNGLATHGNVFLYDISKLDARNGFKITGVNADDFAGGSVSGGGDINGDGFADLLVGAPQAYGGAGAAYAVFGFGTKVNISADGKTATLLDSDGDLITVKASKSYVLQRDNFEVGPYGGLIGLDMESQWFSPGFFNGMDLSITAVKAPGGTGDGLVNVESLLFDGVDLGNVKVGGRLGLIHAGDANFNTVGVKTLTVNRLGSATAGSDVFETKIAGALGSLTVNGDVLDAAISVAGRTKATIGKVAIKGSLIDSLLYSGGNLTGPVTIGGDVSAHGDLQGIISGGKLGPVTITGNLKSSDAATPVLITALGKPGAKTAADALAITSLIVGKGVTNAKILAGYSASLAPANPDASIGAVTVGGNWTASSLAAGMRDADGDGFGQNDVLIGGDTTPAIFASIGAITIKGTATGSTTGGDFFGITAQRLTKLVVGTKTTTFHSTLVDDVLIDTANNDFRAVDFA